MDHWISQFNEWQSAIAPLVPTLKSQNLSGEHTIAPDELWSHLGDDHNLEQVTEFLESADLENPPAPGFKPQWERFERQKQGFIEQSQDRLLDSYRYLLADRLHELVPVEEWINLFLQNRFLRANRSGDGLLWKPPVSQKGRERLVQQLLPSFHNRLNQILQDCLSALDTRSERIRTEILEISGYSEHKGLKALHVFFKRRHRETGRELVLSVQRPLAHHLGELLSQLDENWENKDAFEAKLKTFVGPVTWPLNARGMVARGYTLQAILYGAYVHLGFLTGFEIKNCLMWQKLFGRLAEQNQHFQKEERV